MPTTEEIAVLQKALAEATAQRQEAAERHAVAGLRNLSLGRNLGGGVATELTADSGASDANGGSFRSIGV